MHLKLDLHCVLHVLLFHCKFRLFKFSVNYTHGGQVERDRAGRDVKRFNRLRGGRMVTQLTCG